MKRFKTLSLVFSAVIMAGSFGCGSDDNGGGGTKTATFTGVVKDFKTGTVLDGMTVKAMDNDTGEELGIEATSDASGKVTLEKLPVGKVGFWVVGNENYANTYQFNIDSDEQDWSLIAVDAMTYQAVPALAGIDQKEGNSAVAGAFVWKNADGEDEPVACGTVKAFANGNETGDVRYFGDSGMPTTLDNRDSVNPLNGYYLVGNVPPGKITIKGYDPNGEEVGSITFPSVADSISISTLYVDSSHTSNPGGCPE